MTRYVVTNPKEDTYLNNIHLDRIGCRMIGVNLVKDVHSITVMKFTSEQDAQNVVDRAKRFLKMSLSVKRLEL